LLSQPDVPREAPGNVLRNFGVEDPEAIFVPSGDANSAVFHVTAKATKYFLKLRCGDFDEITANLPAYLHSKGLVRVMAPMPAMNGQPWIHAYDFDWMLYPFITGKNGFQQALTRAHWIALGETMRTVHGTIPPPTLARRVPRESYPARHRMVVKALDQDLARRRNFDDRATAGLAELWRKHRIEIRSVVERSEELIEIMRGRTNAFVLCHSDLHAGNVLIDAADQLTIVDWDNPIFAPRERDLMFVGGGVGGKWNEPQETEWFFAGYGPAEIDRIAIAFYRYERIVVDIAEYGERIFGGNSSVTDRLTDLRKLETAFLPDNVIAMAHKSYADLN
jgi:spectinomycin phosphotransferase